jgi:hypothetical protein
VRSYRPEGETIIPIAIGTGSGAKHGSVRSQQAHEEEQHKRLCEVDKQTQPVPDLIRVQWCETPTVGLEPTVAYFDYRSFVIISRISFVN